MKIETTQEIKCEEIGILQGSRWGKDQNRRVYDVDGIAPTIQTSGGGNREPKILQRPHGFNVGGEFDICPVITTSKWQDNNYVLEADESERFFAQAKETIEQNDCESGDTIDAYNQKVNKSGISPTITTRPEGFKTAVLPVETSIVKNGEIEVGKRVRVRKLTERECFRLMGVKDEDFDRIAKNQSKSSLYHLAGDSIVVDVLMAIFKMLYEGA